MRLIALALLTGALLSGCMGRSPQERYAEAQNACTSYGFKSGTDAYAQCMMELDIAMAQQDQAAAQRFAASMQALAARNRSVTCSTSASVYGGGRYSGGYTYGNSTTTCR